MPVKIIDVHEFKNRYDADPSLCLIDVREQDEWDEGHIPRAIHIPQADISKQINHLKADKHLKELGWRLRTLPREPVGAAWRILGTGRTDHRWLQYLEPFGVAAATA